MKNEVLKFIRDNNLSPFGEKKTIKSNSSLIFKTPDARAINQKIINKIEGFFEFDNSSQIINYFQFTDNLEEIKRRQEFFSGLTVFNREFLRKLIKPKVSWNPKYNVVVVTENEETFMELKRMDCPVQYITNENDVANLENCEIIQVLDCEDYSSLLERLPQTVFLNSLDEAYLERYVEKLSAWADNFKVLEKEQFNSEIFKIINQFKPILDLIGMQDRKKITLLEIQEKLEEINLEISNNIKSMTLSGDLFFDIISKNKIPKEIESVIKKAIEKSGLPSYLFNLSIPVSLDEKEVSIFLKKQDAEDFTSVAELIKKNSSLLITFPEKIKQIEEEILYFDFISGIMDFCNTNNCSNKILLGDRLKLDNTTNLLIERAQPISFLLDNNSRCSILTGANSGGKTTLLEHIIQLITLLNFGLPSTGIVEMPVFSEIYYFAKNKGSANKGAFETLLTQMSQIKSGARTLILADEIESVTEPGIAGNIISATCEYFIKQRCFLVIATHLGQEVKKSLPEFSRIDGIEAKGLDENFNLIVDHNPVLGRLANSTPELIVEKMANIQRLDYFVYLRDYLKKIKAGL